MSKQSKFNEIFNRFNKQLVEESQQEQAGEKPTEPAQSTNSDAKKSQAKQQEADDTKLKKIAQTQLDELKKRISKANNDKLDAPALKKAADEVINAALKNDKSNTQAVELRNIIAKALGEPASENGDGSVEVVDDNATEQTNDNANTSAKQPISQTPTNKKNIPNADNANKNLADKSNEEGEERRKRKNIQFAKMLRNI